MAPIGQIELRAAFLNDASHLLAVSSPAAAAFLGSTRDKLLEAVELELTPRELDTLRRESCGACGNLLIQGWSCKTGIGLRCAEKRAKGKVQAKDSTRSEKAATYTCLRCHRETSHAIEKRSAKKLKRTVLQSDEKPAPELRLSSRVDQKLHKTVNASSKQRQKARRGGLQAMLERNKTQTSSSGGFDLMDFAL